MIDLTTYALLRKQIATAASGVSDVRAEGDELVFVLADGNEVRVAIPATEIRDAVVRDDVLVLTLEDGKEVVVDATLTKEGQAADAKVTGEAVRKLKSDLGDLHTRLNAVDDKDFEIEWEQGAYVGADYKTKRDSSGQIRTSTYLEWKRIKSFSVNTDGGYTFRAHFYDADYNFLSISNNSISPNTNTAKTVYVTICVINYETGITPDTDFGLQIGINSNGVVEKVNELTGSIDGINSIVTFVQKDVTMITSKQLIPRNVIYYASVADGYLLRLNLYDKDKTLIKTNAFEKYQELSEYDFAFCTVDIRKEDWSAISIDDAFGYSQKTFLDYIRSKDDRNVVNVTRHQHPIINACLRNPVDSSLSYGTQFGAMMIADLHGIFNVLDDTETYRTLFASSWDFGNIPIINAGDIVSGQPKNNGIASPEIQTYMEKAEQYEVYHCMGQHECGFAYDYARHKNTCMTHDEVFNTFIAPMKAVWGLDDLSTIYYYKDFTDKKVRLISLYQYNAPIIDDPSDATLYKYARGIVWHGQEQLEWLCDTLKSVPDNYGVIIMMHQNEYAIDNTYNTPFYNGKNGDSTGCSYVVANGTPVYDIVDAYIKRSTLERTYVSKDDSKYAVSDGFTETISADFSDAKGRFLSYVTGDAHIDLIGTIKDFGHPNIGLTSSGTSADCVIKRLGYGTHTRQTGLNADSTLFTIVGYSYVGNIARVGRIGQQFSSNGQIRQYMAFPLIS